MSLWRKRMRAGLGGLGLATALVFAGPLAAQDSPLPLLVLDQDRFFLESEFGQAAARREQASGIALEQENDRIEAELVAEERALTIERATLPAKEFADKAAAFDAKVERIRAEQAAKLRTITEARDAARKAFREAALPVLGELLVRKQAMAILDRTQVIQSVPSADVTDEAIALVNEALKVEASPEP